MAFGKIQVSFFVKVRTAAAIQGYFHSTGITFFWQDSWRRILSCRFLNAWTVKALAFI